MRLSHIRLAAGVYIAALGGVAWGQPHPAPDLAHGAAIAQGCLTCHGADVTVGQPPYHAPRLFNQNTAYLARALRDYSNGRRDNAIMHDQAAALTERDIADVTAYLAGQRGKPPPHNTSGLVPRPVVETCSACHGETGLASMPEVAMLSGQHADYLEHALKAYASGERKNPVMPPFARRLSDADRAAVAAYFARLGALKTAR